jgi:hypothetical protein
VKDLNLPVVEFLEMVAKGIHFLEEYRKVAKIK